MRRAMDPPASNGDQRMCRHTIGATGRCKRMGCGMHQDEIAASLEPARHVTVDPNELMGWEDDQSEDKVRALMEAMEAGDPVPPIMVSESGTALYDGHHRAEAARRVGRSVRAVVIPSSWVGRVDDTLPDLRRFARLTLPDAWGPRPWT